MGGRNLRGAQFRANNWWINIIFLKFNILRIIIIIIILMLSDPGTIIPQELKEVCARVSTKGFSLSPQDRPSDTQVSP